MEILIRAIKLLRDPIMGKLRKIMLETSCLHLRMTSHILGAMLTKILL